MQLSLASYYVMVRLAPRESKDVQTSVKNIGDAADDLRLIWLHYIFCNVDDGVDSHALQLLASRLRQEGHRCLVVAPDRNKSAAR